MLTCELREVLGLNQKAVRERWEYFTCNGFQIRIKRTE